MKFSVNLWTLVFLSYKKYSPVRTYKGLSSSNLTLIPTQWLPFLPRPIPLLYPIFSSIANPLLSLVSALLRPFSRCSCSRSLIGLNLVRCCSLIALCWASFLFFLTCFPHARPRSVDLLLLKKLHFISLSKIDDRLKINKCVWIH